MITTNNPFTNEDIETYKLHTESEVQEIINKGANAFKDWKMKSIGDRTDMLNKVSQLLLERKQVRVL